jgi:hypothetical protein
VSVLMVFAILLIVTWDSLGIFVFYNSAEWRSTAGSDSVIAGTALFSLLPCAISSQGRQ